MAIQALAPFISCVCDASDFKQALDEGYKEIYVKTMKGTFKHHQLRGENRFVRVKVDKIPGYQEPEIDQAMNFLPDGKIPYRLYEQIEAFFRKVIKVRGAALEAMIFILWNKEQGYHLYVPEQSVAAASVRFDPSTLPGGSTVVVNVHSHGTMSAFFSGTDDNNDKDLVQFSGVFGQFQNPVPSTVWRFNYYDTKFKCDASAIFEEPATKEIEVPEEWMSKVTQMAAVAKGGYSGQGNVVSHPTSGRRWDHLERYQFKSKEQLEAQQKNTSPQNQSGRQNEESVEHRNTLGGKDLNFNGFDPEEYPDFSTPATTTKRTNDFAPPGVPNAAWKWDTRTGGWRNVAGTPEENDDDVIVMNSAGRINEEADEGFQRAIGSEAAFVHVSEDPEYSHLGEEAGSVHVGKQVGTMLDADPQLQLSLDRSEKSSTAEDEATADMRYQYEAIASRYGAEVADAWWDIDVSMSNLHEHPLLLQSLMSDMFMLMDPKNQHEFFMDMFNSLPDDIQKKIQEHGL